MPLPRIPHRHRSLARALGWPGPRARRWPALAALAVTLGLAACASTSANDASSTTAKGTNVNAVANGKFAKPIVLGAGIALTGINQVNDAPPMLGIKAEIANINKAGGIDGQPVKIIPADTTSTVAGGRSAALSVVSKGAQILLATCNYDLGVSEGEVGQSDGMMTWSLCAANPEWGLQGIGSMAFVDSVMTYPEGNVDAQFGSAHLGKHVFLLCDTYIDYTQEVCQGFKNSVAQYGLTVAGSATFNSVTDPNISEQISKIKNTPGVNWIELATFQPGGITALREIRAAGISVPVVSDTATYGLAWLKSVPHLDNFYVDTEASMTGDDPRPAVNTLTKAYKAQYGQWPDNGNYIEGYALMQILKQLLTTTKTTNGTALAHALIKQGTFQTVIGPKHFTATEHFDTNQQMVMVEYSTSPGQTYSFPHYVTTVTPRDVDYHLHS